MFLRIGVFAEDYNLKNTKQEYLERVFLDLITGALSRYPEHSRQGVQFVFEKECELFERFLPISKLYSINYSLVDEVVLSDYPLVICHSKTSRNKARRLLIPSFTL